MPKVGRRRRDTRGALLAATVHVVHGGGVEAARTRAIAERGGVSEGAVCRHFDGTQELDLMLRTGLLRNVPPLIEESVLRGPVVRHVDAVTDAAPCALACEAAALPNRRGRRGDHAS